MKQFADDSNLLKSGPDGNIVLKLILDDLRSIQEYCRDNLLILNTSKSKLMVFSRHNKTQSVNLDDLDGFLIEKVSNFKYLGFRINDSLNWNDHINYIVKNLSHTHSILLKLQYLPRNIRLLIFNAIALPHILYGILLYNNSTKFNLNKINSKYNACARAIYGYSAAKFLNTQYVLNECEMLPFNNLMDKHITNFILKSINQETPEYISSYFLNLNRRSLNFEVPRVLSRYGTESFSFKGPIYWNKLPLAKKKSLLNC